MKRVLDLASRYRLSRESGKKTTAIARLKEDGKPNNVSKPAAPLETVSESQDTVIFESTRVAIMALIKLREGIKKRSSLMLL
jgi:hypothetical protein